MNIIAKNIFRIAHEINWNLLLYLFVCLVPLFLVNQASDLPIWIGNGEAKAKEILSLQLPSDNFYPIGKALMLLPFVWLSPNYFPVVVLYFMASSTIYYLICQMVPNPKFRLIALVALPVNSYLVWLCYSSQDTVFELFLLLALTYSAIKNKFYMFIISGFMLCLTRPSYWIICIGLVTFLLISKKKQGEVNWKKYLLFFLLIPINLVFNLYAYGNYSLAGESGITTHFSYNKNLYLALPNFDMDVFLSTKENNIIEGLQPDDGFMQIAIHSLKNNPKEVILATMQKLNSYVFDAQKVPHLPGEYYLSSDQKSIIIGNERLSWVLVLGNLEYEIYRSLVFAGLLISIGFLLVFRRLNIIDRTKRNALWLLMFPWILGIIPGLLFYTETRFKIVSELLLVPFILVILSVKIPKTDYGKEHALE